MRRALFVFVLLGWIITACAPPTPAPESAATEGPSIIIERPTPAPTHIRVDLTPAQRAALTALSDKLGLPVDKITLVSTQAVTWPDGCLGVVRMGVMCTQAEVPGFKIVLSANGKKYEFHTNQDGSVLQLVEGTQNAGSAEQMVIKQLAANLRIKESDITVLSSESVEFKDGCLGVAMTDMMCAQVVTPGRIIVLEANGLQYEYHTSADGSRVQPATLALVWKRQGGIAGFCDTLTVFLSGEVYVTSCKPQADGRMGTFAKLLSADEQARFTDWMNTFAMTNLDASDPKNVSDRMVVTLDVFGTGTKPPTRAEQKALFQFAQDLFQKLTQ